MTDDSNADFIARLPSPAEVRAHLGALLRRLELTRKLLRLSERRERLKALAIPDTSGEAARHA
jgi:hypothetical protein